MGKNTTSSSGRQQIKNHRNINIFKTEKLVFTADAVLWGLDALLWVSRWWWLTLPYSKSRTSSNSKNCDRARPIFNLRNASKPAQSFALCFTFHNSLSSDLFVHEQLPETLTDKRDNNLEIFLRRKMPLLERNSRLARLAFFMRLLERFCLTPAQIICFWLVFIFTEKFKSTKFLSDDTINNIS